MTFYRTTNSSIHAGLANSLFTALAQPGSLIPITSRAYCKTPAQSSIRACMSENLVFALNFVLCTLYFYLYSVLFSPLPQQLPSTAAAPPFAAAITPVCCAKSAFFALLPQLSSPLLQHIRILAAQ